MKLAQVILQCQQDDAIAKQLLYEMYAEAMFLYCRRLLYPDENAEDAVAAGFISVLTTIKKFTYINDNAFEGWIRKIMLRECIKIIKERTKFVFTADDLPENAASYEPIINQTDADDIYRIVAKMPADIGAVLNLTIEGLSRSEVAAMLNITPDACKYLLKKARAILAQILIRKSFDYESERN